MELQRLDGLKTETKRAFVRAFRKGLTDEFWKTLDKSMNDVRIEDHVLEDFPVKAMEFPLVRIAVSFSGTNWQNLSRYTFSNASQYYQTAEVKARINVDLFAVSSIQRDRLQDGYLCMLLFAYTKPEHSAFTEELTKAKKMQVSPILNSIAIGSDSVSNRVPWCEGVPVYSSSLSFDAQIAYAMDRGDVAAIVRDTSVNIDMEQ